VQANIKAALCENVNLKSSVFNIALGERTALNDLLNTLKSKMGATIEPAYAPSRIGDVRDSLANIEKAMEDFEYKPEIDISKGLEITLNWFKNNGSFISRRE